MATASEDKETFILESAMRIYKESTITRDVKRYAETKLLEDFEIVCKRIELFKLVDNIDERAPVYIRKAKDKPIEIKPDYEYAIVYNKPEDLAFIGAACELDPDLLWKTKYTQAIERALNYLKKYSTPTLIINEDTNNIIDLSSKHAGLYYKTLSAISDDASYKAKFKKMVCNLINAHYDQDQTE
jgi:hypothetical protein